MKVLFLIQWGSACVPLSGPLCYRSGSYVIPRPIQWSWLRSGIWEQGRELIKGEESLGDFSYKQLSSHRCSYSFREVKASLTIGPLSLWSEAVWGFEYLHPHPYAQQVLEWGWLACNGMESTLSIQHSLIKHCSSIPTQPWAAQGICRTLTSYVPGNLHIAVWFPDAELETSTTASCFPGTPLNLAIPHSCNTVSIQACNCPSEKSQVRSPSGTGIDLARAWRFYKDMWQMVQTDKINRNRINMTQLKQAYHYIAT